MTNFLIICDDRDSKLGHYFAQCYDSLCNFLHEQGFTKSIKAISGMQCTEVNVDLRIEAFSPSKFVFVAYSHGTENSLSTNDDVYVYSSGNISKFANCLFYTTACSCGAFLGKQLIAEGCLAFIGYDKEVRVSLNSLDIFNNCDNAGLYFFWGQELTIFEAYEKMKKYFTQQAGKLQPFDRAELIYARDALVFYGNRSLTKHDMFNNG